MYCQRQEREEIKVESTQDKRIAKKRQETSVVKPEMKPKSSSDMHVPGNLHFQGLLPSQELRHLINLHQSPQLKFTGRNNRTHWNPYAFSNWNKAERRIADMR